MAASRYEIQIDDRSGSKTIDTALLKKKIRGILAAMKWEKAAVNIILVSDSGIRKINKEHLAHDWATDVISFSHLDHEGVQPLVGGKPFLGDIVISAATARRNAKEYGNSLLYEICFYVCHGILHIAGFDDSTKKDRQRMLNIQAALLEDAGIKPMPEK